MTHDETVDETRDETVDEPSGRAAVGVEHHGDGVVLHVSGELDLLTTPTLTDAITGAMRAEPTVLVIDLSAVEFIASRGLEALLMAHQSAGKTSVRVVSNSMATARSLDVSGLTDHLHVFGTVASALAAVTMATPGDDSA
ncbi:MAG: STAS domain-containing protein [Actinophytocola sp.]|uniref:STAS domain-containing protein n=1 Tax=Actinophytocola sp. TaxID=1872138 RepID=UPI003D6BC5B4